MKFSAKPAARRVMGIDASTQSIAYCVFWNRRPIAWGEWQLKGQDVFERTGDAYTKAAALAKQYDVDLLVIERAIYVQNKQTVIKLAQVFGAIIGAFVAQGIRVIDVSPREWMGAIGNVTTRKTKQDVAAKFRTKSKRATELRRLRKQYTLDFFNKRYNLELESDNVADAMAIAYTGYYELSERP